MSKNSNYKFVLAAFFKKLKNKLPKTRYSLIFSKIFHAKLFFYLIEKCFNNCKFVYQKNTNERFTNSEIYTYFKR